MRNAQELEGDELLAALGIELDEPQIDGYTPRQERLLAGFEDVMRFRETNGRSPQHGEHLDIFERLYAVRLDQLRKQPEDDLALLRPLDRFGLLTMPETETRAEPLSEDELLAALTNGDSGDIGRLVHVQPLQASRGSAESAGFVAERVKCEDFDLYRPLFEAAEADLAAERRFTKAFEKDASIEQGDFFVLDGQVVYVAAVGETFKTSNADTQGRLRVVYSNGTESNILLRSLQRALYEKHRNGRRLTTPDLGPLFGDTLEPDDTATGTIYVVQSFSKEPQIAALQGSLYKIGVTGGSVDDRIANSSRDPTFLLAPVEMVRNWQLANIRPFQFEQLTHRVFASAQLRLNIPDRFGRAYEPKEWFVVPLPVIDEAIQRIRDRSIVGYVYDVHTATLRKA